VTPAAIAILMTHIGIVSRRGHSSSRQ
jgi:hypothetical protein